MEKRRCFCISVACLIHMFSGGKTQGEKLSQPLELPGSVGAGQIYGEIPAAKLGHYLAADAAGGEVACDDAVLAAADGNGGKISAAVTDCFEYGGAFSADCRGEGGVFDVAALVNGAVTA